MIANTHKPALTNIADLVVQTENGAVKAIANAQTEENERIAQLSGMERG